MKIIKASTKTGQRLLDSALRCTHRTLSEIYGRYSAEKERAYQNCLREYDLSENPSSFGIARSGCDFFTASWYCDIDGKRAMRYETGRNSYAIILAE